MAKMLRKIALTAALVAALGTGKLIAQENPSYPPVKTEQTLLIKNETGSRGISFIDYLYQSDSYPPSVQEILGDLKDNSIMSYQQLVDQTKKTTTNNQLMFLSAVSDLLYKYSYNPLSISNPSTSDLFKVLQEDVKTTFTASPLGTCRQISSAVQQFAEDLGYKSAVVTILNGLNGNHADNLISTPDGIAIINSSQLSITKTNNVEEAMRMYQKSINSVLFQTWMYRDNKLESMLIFPEGQGFIDFLGYDPSIRSLERELLGAERHQSSVRLNIGTEENSISAESILGVINTKIGLVLFPYYNKQMFIVQGGLGKDFRLDSLDIYSKISAFTGDVSGQPQGGNVIGFQGRVGINTKNEEGINAALSMGGNDSFINSIFNPLPGTPPWWSIFNDFNISGGLTYKIPFISQKISGIISPYGIVQYFLAPKDLGTFSYIPQLEELRGGLKTNAKTQGGIIFEVNPFYFWRMDEYGGGIKIGSNDQRLDIKMDLRASKSTYEFNPNKYGMDIGVSFKTGKWKVGVNGTTEVEDYSGKLYPKISINASGSLEF
ncbi:MAG: hypothetical protein KGH55_01765 [Nanoarchaeota archaeon]|nr:hypothetical protein [Nanoarchaeota archaeon]